MAGSGTARSRSDRNTGRLRPFVSPLAIAASFVAAGCVSIPVVPTRTTPLSGVTDLTVDPCAAVYAVELGDVDPRGDEGRVSVREEHRVDALRETIVSGDAKYMLSVVSTDPDGSSVVRLRRDYGRSRRFVRDRYLTGYAPEPSGDGDLLVRWIAPDDTTRATIYSPRGDVTLPPSTFGRGLVRAVSVRDGAGWLVAGVDGDERPTAWRVDRTGRAEIVARAQATATDAVVARGPRNVALVYETASALRFASSSGGDLEVDPDPTAPRRRLEAFVPASRGFWLVLVADWRDQPERDLPPIRRFVHLDEEGREIGRAEIRFDDAETRIEHVRVVDGVLHARVASSRVVGPWRDLAIVRNDVCVPASGPCAPHVAARPEAHPPAESPFSEADAAVSDAPAVEPARADATVIDRDGGTWTCRFGDDGLEVLDPEDHVVLRSDRDTESCTLVSFGEFVVAVTVRGAIRSNEGPRTSVDVHAIRADESRDVISTVDLVRNGRDARVVVDRETLFVGASRRGAFVVAEFGGDGRPTGGLREIASLFGRPEITLVRRDEGPRLRFVTDASEGEIPLCLAEPVPGE